MATNNAENNASSISSLSANSTNANLFKITAGISSTQTLTTSTGGGNIYLCTNASAISVTLPAPSTFNVNYIDFILSSNGSPVTLIAPSGTFNGTGGPTSITIPPGTQSCRIFSNGTGYFTIFGIYNSATLPSGLILPQPVINGITNGSNAAAGTVGELISSIILSTSAMSLTNAVDTPLTSIVLQGDFDLWANAYYIMTAGQQVFCSINTVNNARPDNSILGELGATSGIFTNCGINAPMIRVNPTTATTYYLMTNAVFAGSATVCGGIYARRRR
jgi:hypothetical protein